MVIPPPSLKSSNILPNLTTSHGIYTIFTNNRLPGVVHVNWVWEQARAHADKIQQTNAAYPVPNHDP